MNALHAQIVNFQKQKMLTQYNNCFAWMVKEIERLQSSGYQPHTAQSCITRQDI